MCRVGSIERSPRLERHARSTFEQGTKEALVANPALRDRPRQMVLVDASNRDRLPSESVTRFCRRGSPLAAVARSGRYAA